jgi:hypothetical protein
MIHTMRSEFIMEGMVSEMIVSVPADKRRWCQKVVAIA